MRYFVGHDLGTSGNKAVLVESSGRVLATAVRHYELMRPRTGWAEQDPEDWWNAVTACTREVVEASGVDPREVVGIAFAGQMLALVALGPDGVPTRPAVSWLDGRADEQAARFVRRFGGEKMLHLLAGGSPTGKDIVAKMAWIADHEPEVFARTAAFTDATGFLVAQATGELAIDPTAAGCTGMLDAETRTWAKMLCFLASFPLAKMPRIVRSIDVVGTVHARAAKELGLVEGTKVVMGMADIPAAALGSGATRPGEAHVYLGTSSWIGVSMASPKNVPKAGIASVPSADPHGHLLIGESETAGACREWLARMLVPSSVEGCSDAGPAGGAGDADDALERLAASSAPGSHGLLFLPWMYGERSPVPDTQVRAAFVGLSLEHERGDFVRAVYEGTSLNLRWILDECARVGERCPRLRAIGGGTRSDVWLQTLADVTLRPIERVGHPRLAGAIGAALVAAVGTGDLPSIHAIADRVTVEQTFAPRPMHRATYDRAYEAFRSLYAPLARASRVLGRPM